MQMCPYLIAHIRGQTNQLLSGFHWMKRRLTFEVALNKAAGDLMTRLDSGLIRPCNKGSEKCGGDDCAGVPWNLPVSHSCTLVSHWCTLVSHFCTLLYTVSQCWCTRCHTRFPGTCLTDCYCRPQKTASRKKAWLTLLLVKCGPSSFHSIEESPLQTPTNIKVQWLSLSFLIRWKILFEVFPVLWD